MDDDSDHENVNTVLLLFLLEIILASASSHTDKLPYHNSILSGALRYREIMNYGNDRFFYDCVGMSKDHFVELVEILHIHGGLRNGRFISASEKLMINSSCCEALPSSKFQLWIPAPRPPPNHAALHISTPGL